MFKRVLALLGAWSCLSTTIVLARPATNAAAGPDSADSRQVLAAAAGDAEPGPPADAGAAAPPGALAAWSRSLSGSGVSLSGTMTGLWIGDVAGGVQRGGVVNTLGFFKADDDLGKLVPGWQGAHAFASAAWIQGSSLSSRFVGDALVVSNLDAYDSVRLYEAWIEQGFAGGRASVRAGVLGADDEFCGTDGGEMMTNSAFGWEAGIGANVVNGGPIYDAPGLGLRAQFAPETGWTIRAGVYDGDSHDSPNGDPAADPHGLSFALSRAQGAFLIGETVRDWSGDGHGHKGDLKLGAWRHTADFPDELRDGQGQPYAYTGQSPAIHHGNEGGYAVFEQKLWDDPRDAARGVAGWARVAAAPEDRSLFTWVSEGGVRWIGPLPGRPADALGIAAVASFVSPRVRQQVLDANAADGGVRPLPDFERVIEAAYQANLGAHWVVTPDVQWVQHPGLTPATPDAWVAGLRVTRQ